MLSEVGMRKCFSSLSAFLSVSVPPPSPSESFSVAHDGFELTTKLNQGL